LDSRLKDVESLRRVDRPPRRRVHERDAVSAAAQVHLALEEPPLVVVGARARARERSEDVRGHGGVRGDVVDGDEPLPQNFHVHLRGGVERRQKRSRKASRCVFRD
jgi:hypothetical protein